MSEFNRTVIALADAKESALYFDYIIPVNNGLEVAKFYMNLYTKRAQLGDTPRQILSRFRDVRVFPPEFFDSLLPPDLVNNHDFRWRLLDVWDSSSKLVLAKGEDESWQASDKYGEVCCKLLRDYDLTTTPMDIPEVFIFDDEEPGNEAEIAVTLPALNLIDAQDAPWEQVLEFRRDKDSHNKMRRLRRFASENYSGKSKDFIEDDISLRIADYQEAVRTWRFETKYAAFTTLLNSKILASTVAGSLLSAICGAPLPAVGAALAGVALEVGRITLEVNKRKFALRSLMKDNPACYISEAKSKLTGKH
jgi:hypothetical protein